MSRFDFIQDNIKLEKPTVKPKAKKKRKKKERTTGNEHDIWGNVLPEGFVQDSWVDDDINYTTHDGIVYADGLRLTEFEAAGVLRRRRRDPNRFDNDFVGDMTDDGVEFNPGGQGIFLRAQ